MDIIGCCTTTTATKILAANTYYDFLATFKEFGGLAYDELSW